MRGWRVRRGERELDVTLPDGQAAVVRVAGSPEGDAPEELGVRLAPEHVAVIPGASR